MYNSPIELLYQETPMIDEIVKGIDGQIEKMVCEAVVNCGVNVDKEELLKALNYDRHQYEQGYRDGLEEGYRKAIEDCKAKFRNKFDEFLDSSD